jgi:hypothetical protein
MTAQAFLEIGSWRRSPRRLGSEDLGLCIHFLPQWQADASCSRGRSFSEWHQKRKILSATRRLTRPPYTGLCRADFSSMQQRFYVFTQLHRPPDLFLTRSLCRLILLSRFEASILTTDSREPRLRQFRVKYGRSLNTSLQLLRARPDGDAPTVLAVIDFTIDYCSFVSGSTTKFKLPILDPVHNTTFPLGAGALRTSPLESILSRLKG